MRCSCGSGLLFGQCVACGKDVYAEIEKSEKQERILKIMANTRKQQSECDHSFNDEGKCEYCGVSEDYFDATGIGTYE